MRENQAEYVVTYHGRLVAVLLPVAEAWLAAEAKRAAEAVAAGEVTWANGLLSHCLSHCGACALYAPGKQSSVPKASASARARRRQKPGGRVGSAAEILNYGRLPCGQYIPDERIGPIRRGDARALACAGVGGGRGPGRAGDPVRGFWAEKRRAQPAGYAGDPVPHRLVQQSVYRDDGRFAGGGGQARLGQTGQRIPAQFQAAGCRCDGTYDATRPADAPLGASPP